MENYSLTNPENVLSLIVLIIITYLFFNKKYFTIAILLILAIGSILPFSFRLLGFAFDGYLHILIVVLLFPFLRKENKNIKIISFIFIIYIFSSTLISLSLYSDLRIFKYINFYLAPFFIFSYTKNSRIDVPLLLKLIFLYLLISSIWSWYAYIFKIAIFLEGEGIYRIMGLFGEIAPFYARRINNIFSLGVILLFIQKNLNKKMLYAFIIFSAIALLPTGSRTNWIYFIVFNTGIFVVIKNKRMIIIASIVCFILFSNFYFIQSRLGFGETSANRFHAYGTLYGRIAIWENFFQKTSTLNIIVGNGAGKTKLKLLENSKTYFEHHALHNSILEYISDIGVIGLVIILLFYYFISKRIHSKKLRYIMLLFYISFLISALTDPVLETSINKIYLSVISGIPFAKRIKYQANSFLYKISNYKRNKIINVLQ